MASSIINIARVDGHPVGSVEILANFIAIVMASNLGIVTKVNDNSTYGAEILPDQSAHLNGIQPCYCHESQ